VPRACYATASHKRNFVNFDMKMALNFALLLK